MRLHKKRMIFLFSSAISISFLNFLIYLGHWKTFTCPSFDHVMLENSWFGLELLKSRDWWCFRYPLVLIAMYNVLDLISRYIPLVPSLKLESRNGLLIAVLSRFLLIPAFYFTAKYGDQGWMIFLVSFLGLTNGYLTVCVLTIAPRGYTVSYQYYDVTNVIFWCGHTWHFFHGFRFVGAWSKCVGEFACVILIRWHIFSGCPWLALAHRQKEGLLECQICLQLINKVGPLLLMQCWLYVGLSKTYI